MRNKTSFMSIKTIIKIISLVVVQLMMITLSGCNVSPETEYIFQAVIDRVQKNEDLAKQLNDNGLISDVEYNVINSHLETKREDLLNLSKTLKDNASKNLQSLQDDVTLKAILASSSQFWDVQYDDVSDVYSKQASFENSNIIALLKHYQSTIDLYSNLNQDGQSVQPLEILDDSIKSEIRNQDKGKVYVIDMSKVQGIQNAFNKFFKQVGVDIHFRGHRLRHTSASLMEDSGRNQYQMMSQLGISQLSTLRRYTDRGERLQRQNSETITSAIQERYIDNRNKNKDKNQT